MNKLTIKVLKAGQGNSILLSYMGDDEKGHNILIDGGHKYEYPELKAELEKIIKKKQVLDLVIITHIDQDHINGVLALIEDRSIDDDLIKKFWFNSKIHLTDQKHEVWERNQELISTTETQETTLSPKHGEILTEYLKRFPEKWHDELICIENNNQMLDMFGLKINVIGPEKVMIEDLYERMGSDCSPKSSDYHLSIDDCLKRKYTSDKTKPNNSSIALILEFNRKKILLPGDLPTARFMSNIPKGTKFEFVLLPHHGSFKSIDAAFVNDINGTNFLVSTNGIGNFHPDKTTLVKLAHRNKSKEKTTNIYFNYYRKDVILSKAERRELNIKKYKVKTCFNI